MTTGRINQVVSPQAPQRCKSLVKATHTTVGFAERAVSQKTFSFTASLQRPAVESNLHTCHLRSDTLSRSQIQTQFAVKQDWIRAISRCHFQLSITPQPFQASRNPLSIDRFPALTLQPPSHCCDATKQNWIQCQKWSWNLQNKLQNFPPTWKTPKIPEQFFICLGLCRANCGIGFRGFNCGVASGKSGGPVSRYSGLELQIHPTPQLNPKNRIF